MSTAQFTLTSENASNPATIPFFDAMGAAARAKLNAPPEWEWYAAEVLRPTDDTLVEGGIPNAGQKGRGRWRGVDGQKCVVTPADILAACERYERGTGKCSTCAGTGNRTTGWSSTTGRHWKPCERCKATGLASV